MSDGSEGGERMSSDRSGPGEAAGQGRADPSPISGLGWATLAIGLGASALWCLLLVWLLYSAGAWMLS